MKPYFSSRMLVLPAFALCLIIASCKKESAPAIEINPATATSTEHRTVVR